MLKGILIALGILGALAAAAVAGGLFYLTNSDGTNPLGGLRGPLFYDACDPGGRLTEPALRDAAVRLHAAHARRADVLVSAPHQAVFENACATGSIAVTYAGDLDAAYEELGPAIEAAGWTPARRQTPVFPPDVRATDYSKQVNGVYYRLSLAESKVTTAIVLIIPDAHDPDRFRRIDASP